MLVEPPVFAVADGMGGHRAGDVASRTAIEVMQQHLQQDPSSLVEAVRAANHEVHQQAQNNPDLKDMGTTMTAMVAGDDSLLIVHVGDSRAYLLRDGELSMLTEDHSLVGRMVREGRLRPEDADHHPQKSVIERVLGILPDVKLDSHTVGTSPGDRILLCSDGLTGILEDDEIQAILAEEDDPSSASKRLVQEAVRAGASDNVTVVVVDMPGERRKGPPKVAPTTRRRPGRRYLILGFLVALLLLLAIGARSVIASRWFVGQDAGKVVIFRGIPGSVVGLDLSKVAKRTDLEVASLPPPIQADLFDGIEAEDQSDADLIVSNLRGLKVPETPSPAPGGSP